MKDKIIDEAIRRIPDFPKEGILFYDITGVLVNPKVFQYCIDKMAEYIKANDINAIAAVEARGFVFAGPLADRLGLPLILIRKKGKLPGETYSCSYKLEYGEATIEVHKADINQGQKVAIIDDLIATGGTLKAAESVIEEGGAEVKACLGLVGLPFLNYEKVLGDMAVYTLINYDSE